MSVLCLILFLAVVSPWFFANEYPVLFGPYATARAIRRSYFRLIVSAAVVVALLLSGASDIREGLSDWIDVSSIDGQSLLAVLISSLIILLILRRFSINGSVIYAVLGALEAWRISSGHALDHQVILSFIAAPAIAFAFAAAMRWILKFILGRIHIHLVTLSYYMSFAVVAGLMLLAAAFGYNWGGFLMAVADLISVDTASLWVVVSVVLLSFVATSLHSGPGHEEMDGRYSDFSMYAVLSVGYAVAFTLLFFSFKGTAGMLGLKPVPLSVGSLVFASVAGVEMVKKSHLMETDDYAKEGLALILAPLGSMVITYLLLYVSGRNDDQILDFTVISSAILVLMAVIFSGYLLNVRRQREATDRLVYTQQQQIYENSRALNDMELKVVVAENQALHNAVEMKKQEVMNVALGIVEQKEYLLSLNETVKQLAKAQDEKERDRLIAELGYSLSQRLSYESDVDSQYFYAQAESLHEDFNSKLSENFPGLTQQERKLATLLRLGFSSKYIATLMNVTPKSVEISRYRLRQKLGLSKGDNLVNYIKSI